MPKNQETYDGLLQLTYSYQSVDVKGERVFKGTVEAKNVAKNTKYMTLQNVIVNVDVNDETPYWAAGQCDAQGIPVNPYVPKPLRFRNLGAGQCDKKTLYWKCYSSVSGESRSDKFGVTIGLIPNFTVDYDAEESALQSKYEVTIS